MFIKKVTKTYNTVKARLLIRKLEAQIASVQPARLTAQRMYLNTYGITKIQYKNHMRELGEYIHNRHQIILHLKEQLNAQ